MNRLKSLLVLTSLMLSLVAGSLYAEGDYVIYRNDGKEISVNEIAQEMISRQVVFFGEFHDDAVCHALKLELLMKMHALDPKIVVSMEMFERDAQDVLIDYLNDKITEEIFLKESRPWPNYETDYKPIIEFARKHKLHVIAANVPRKYAALIARNGAAAINDIPVKEKQFAAERLVILDDEYKTSFMDTMQRMTAHGMPGSSELYENIYAAQCLKDDTMAESINLALRDYPDYRVIHYNGDFHSRRHLGTVQKLKLLSGLKNIAVIAPAYIDSQSPLRWESSLQNEGDYLILIHKAIDNEPETKPE